MASGGLVRQDPAGVLPAVNDGWLSLARTATLSDLEGLVENAIAAEHDVLRAYAALALIHDRHEYEGSFERYAYDRFGISESSSRRWLKVGRWLLDELKAGRPAVKPPSQRTLDTKPQVSGRRARRVLASKDNETANEAKAEPTVIPVPPRPDSAPTRPKPAPPDPEPPAPSSRDAQAVKVIGQLVGLRPDDVGGHYPSRREWQAAAKRLLRWATDFDAAARSTGVPAPSRDVQPRPKAKAG